MLLERWCNELQPLFAALRAEPSINVSTQSDGLLNGQFHAPDAEVYAAVIADRKPTRIVEVGAGYSTRVARKSIDELGLATELCVIDPAPRVAVEMVADRFVQKRLEDAVAELGIGAGTMLFIDSSHVVQTGGDIPVLFNQVLPGLPRASWCTFTTSSSHGTTRPPISGASTRSSTCSARCSPIPRVLECCSRAT